MKEGAEGKMKVTEIQHFFHLCHLYTQPLYQQPLVFSRMKQTVKFYFPQTPAWPHMAGYETNLRGQNTGFRCSSDLGLLTL